MFHKVIISAGEPSGDVLAAGLVTALKSINPELEFSGMGGESLGHAGVKLIVDIAESGSVMGFTEVGLRIGRVLNAHRQMKQALLSDKPDLLILVDFGDFNLRLASFARKIGVPVFYFVPPKVWAWRKSRISVLKKVAQKICVIYPYEKKFLESNGIDNVHYVGNPWADEIKNLKAENSYQDKRKEYLKKIGVDPSKKVIAVFPGSRPGEIRKHLDILFKAFRILLHKHKDIHFVIPQAQGLTDDQILVPQDLPVTIRRGEQREILAFAHAGIIKSGTSNLEAALSGLPFFMFFKTSKFTSVIVKGFVGLKEYSPVNILRSGTVPEILQNDFQPDRIAAITEQLLFDENIRNQQAKSFNEIRSMLSEGLDDKAQNAYLNAALLADSELKKSQKKPKLLKRVLTYVGPFKWTFISALLCMIVFGASDGFLPILLKHILDGVFQEKNLELLYIIPAIIVGFAVIRGLADFGQEYLMAKVGHGVVRDIRNDLNKHILKLSSDFFLINSSANLLARITSDVLLVRTLLTDAFAAVLRDGVRITALIISAVYLDPTLALIAVIGFPLGIYPVYKFGKRMRRLSKRGQEEIGALSSMLQESIVGQRVVKAFGREQFEIGRFEGKNQELTRTFLKSERVRALTGPVNELLGSCAIAGVIFYGGFSVIVGARTQGDFLAFLVALFLLYDPFKKLTRMNSTVQQGLSGAERIFEILDNEPTVLEVEDPVPLTDRNDIEFHNVHFNYTGSERSVLTNVSLKVAEGKKVALVGLSGAGKSTLIDLIPRFIEPVAGQVTIGGVDIANVAFSELRRRIAVVGQHTFLFNDTIYNNIAYGRPDATSEEVVAAARAAFAFDFISSLKEGFNTVVGEGGYSLSGGERQRISIARAILKDAPILILDEATASLDNQSEREVQHALEALEKNRTCVIIAHRLSTVQHADLIVVMRAGEIVEKGNHEDLISLQGEYSKLHSLQFQDRGGVPLHESAY